MFITVESSHSLVDFSFVSFFSMIFCSNSVRGKDESLSVIALRTQRELALPIWLERRGFGY